LDIWRAVAEYDPAAADRQYDRIEARLDILRKFPEAGVSKPNIAPDARMLVEPPYLIFYRRRADHVQIVRILHGARDIDAQLIAEGLE